MWLGGRFPGRVEVAGRRGLHRHKPGARPGGILVEFHAGAAVDEEATSLAGVRVAGLARCCADALRWTDLGLAIPLVMDATRAGAVSPREVAALVAAESPRGFAAARQRSAWSAIASAWRR